MKEIKQRVGVYGGGFDPVHNAHLLLAKTAVDALGLDRVLFVPSAGQAHYKKISNLASGEHRLAMLKLALAGESAFEASDIEIQQDSFCYTIDTLRKLRSDNPETDYILLIGGDWKQKLHSWKEGDQIPREFAVALFSRPGFDVETNLTPSEPTERIYTVKMPLLDISSSNIRERLSKGEPIHGLVPDAIAEYIQVNGLYHR
ncbi:MAG: nicotinate-nucleotide adenylyltransferase [Candidatus Hinthialibacter antarcticus]|nr:nicotinate-nucleotide adenylyltransferase [Candidatus Hinthialibacter antarcticus]